MTPFGRILAALTILLATLLPAPATAGPPSGPLVQVNTGTGNGSAFTASLKKSPVAGNVIVIIVGLDAVAAVGTLEPDDIPHVIGMSESWTAYQVAGAPYVITYGAAADPNVKTWGFHGTSQKITWVAAELRGVTTYESGVPIWDGSAAASNHLVDGTSTTLATSHRANTATAHEVIFAGFNARVTTGTPPAIVGFANTYTQAGTWTAFETAVTSGPGANHRLSVAWKEVTAVGSFDCTATWGGAPSGMSASLIGLRAN